MAKSAGHMGGWGAKGAGPAETLFQSPYHLPPVFLYHRMAQIPFHIHVNTSSDADEVTPLLLSLTPHISSSSGLMCFLANAIISLLLVPRLACRHLSSQSCKHSHLTLPCLVDAIHSLRLWSVSVMSSASEDLVCVVATPVALDELLAMLRAMASLYGADNDRILDVSLTCVVHWA
jgi:hypothetical protein